MNYEYEKRRSQPHPERSQLDEEALRFVKSWHRHPALHDLLWYKGVNLGEADEFEIMHEVLTWLIQNEPTDLDSK